VTDQELQQKRLVAAAIDIGVFVGLVLVFVIVRIILSLVMRSVTDSVMAHLMLRSGIELVTALVTLGYILGRDVVLEGRSVGKKVMDIRVVTSAGKPIEFSDSMRRNAIFGVGSALSVIHGAIGMVPCFGTAIGCLMAPLLILAFIFGVAAVVVEIIKFVTDAAGQRFGDQWAGTKVVR